MKKLLLLFLLIIFLFFNQSSANVVIWSGSGGTTTCQVDTNYDNSTSTGSTAYHIGRDADHKYAGGWWLPTYNMSICRIDVSMFATGDISAKSYVCRIWTVAATAYIVTEQTNSPSTAVTGNNSWNDTVVSFIFATPVDITGTGAQRYGFTIDQGSSYDDTNYAYIKLGNTNPWGGETANWKETKVVIGSSAKTPHKAVIWRMQ